MEHQNSHVQHPKSTSLSGPQNGSSVVTKPESVPPEPYDLITLIKRERRWEQVFDIDGRLFEVREARATKHGFDLLFGYPASVRLGPGAGGLNGLIATPPLVAYWETNRTNEGFCYDLPAGRSTIKRMRRRLRLNFVTDRRNLWKKRTTDLATLPTREFAERYNVTKEMTNAWRLSLVGSAVRPADWWHHPAALAVLRNPDITCVEIAKALKIGFSHASRLRRRALNIDPELLEQEVAEPIPSVPLVRKPTNPPIPPENPFRHNKKQGELFVYSLYWRRGKPLPEEVKIAEPLAPIGPKRRRGRKHSHSKATAKTLRQTLLPFDAPRGPQAKPILQQVQDFQGTFYDVYEARPTKHSFDLLFGYKTRAHWRLYTDEAKPGLIPTPELIAYWDSHRLDMRGNLDLPAGATTLVRLRRRLGYNVVHNADAIWESRADDLKTLSIHEFARKYGVTESLAYKRRRDLLSRSNPQRSESWAQDPAVQEILQSKLSSTEVAKKLGITKAHARHLRAQPASNSIPPLYEKWKTPVALAALRSSLTNKQVGKALGVSGSHVARLRQALACDADLAA